MEARPLEVHVPALLLYEVGNVLLLKTRLGTARLDDAMDRLETIPFIVAPPATPLLKRAARLGRELGLTFIDATNPFVETSPKLVLAGLAGKGASEAHNAFSANQGGGEAHGARWR